MKMEILSRRPIAPQNGSVRAKSSLDTAITGDKGNINIQG